MKSINKASQRQIERFSNYLKYLVVLKNSKMTIVTSAKIASMMKCSEESVRKDLQLVSSEQGTPGQGRDIDTLIKDIESFLGYNEKNNVIIVGIGNIGRALMQSEGYQNYGINVVAGFDINVSADKKINNIHVYDISKLEEIIKKEDVITAVLTTPKNVAQEIANKLVEYGIKVIYNFVPLYLIINDDDVLVENIDIASQIALLTNKKRNIGEK